MLFTVKLSIEKLVQSENLRRSVSAGASNWTIFPTLSTSWVFHIQEYKPWFAVFVGLLLNLTLTVKSCVAPSFTIIPVESGLGPLLV